MLELLAAAALLTAPAATDCRSTEHIGLRFTAISTVDMPCRRARRYATVRVPATFDCQHAYNTDGSLTFLCARQDPERAFTFTVL